MVASSPPESPTTGFALMELVIVLALSALLLVGLVLIALAASSSTQLQRNQAQLQENTRLAFSTLSRVVRRAGFSPQPWSTQFPSLGPVESSLDNVSAAGDRLVVRDWSDLNCFDNRNPVVDASGKPLFYTREFVFDINTAKSLTHQCRYGPSLDDLITQVRRQGFINEIESFQVLYGKDSDLDGNIDSWNRASGGNNVLGLRIGLLLSSQEPVLEPLSLSYEVLDATVKRPADGRLRRVTEFTVMFKGRTG